MKLTSGVNFKRKKLIVKLHPAKIFPNFNIKSPLVFKVVQKFF